MIIPCARSKLPCHLLLHYSVVSRDIYKLRCGSLYRTFWIDLHRFIDRVLPIPFSNVRCHYRPVLLHVIEKVHEPLSTMIRPWYSCGI